MDIDPDEFDVLEPRKRERLPLLQITDHLVNGAGFSRRLAERDASGQPFVVQLIDSMLNSKTDRLVAGFHEAEHRRTCHQSCYRCLQRYGNRQYHGLLDWRLGLGFLRTMMDPNYRSGLNGNWTDFPEIVDWPEMARNVCDELCRLNSEKRKPVELGDGNLPGLKVDLGGGDEVLRARPSVMADEPSRVEFGTFQERVARHQWRAYLLREHFRCRSTPRVSSRPRSRKAIRILIFFGGLLWKLSRRNGDRG